ncbi:UNVERIFIED_CONTAM: hypothetical protein GTU68_036773 [Idotea baltica]|nr:hypothetical protein [Idotea baltica]
MGPTAAGKTDLAIALVNELPCELISVDSALIYRDMSIGSAKPDEVTLKKYPHKLIDILDPSQNYSVAEFRRDAMTAMHEITQRGHIPLLVGGTMLYFKALEDGLAELPGSNDSVRKALMERMLLEGLDSLHQELAQIDPVSAARIHANDTQRLIRALEVYQLTNVTMTEHYRAQAINKSYQFPYALSKFAVAPLDRSVLHERIAKRFMHMLENGFIEEVEYLRERGDLGMDLPSMRSVGYRQVWSYLDERINYQQLCDQGISATRQLAKRQLTWLRKWNDIHWLHDNEQNNLLHILQYLRHSSIV